MNQPESISNIYLLVEQGGQSFKIGKADDVLARAATLPQTFDDSIYFQCISDKVYDIEKVLHYMFKDFNQPKDAGDGRTEWFDAQCFADCKKFILDNQTLLGIQKIIEIDKKRFYQSPDNVIEPVSKIAKEIQIQAAIKQHNLAILQQLKESIECLRSQNAAIDKQNQVIRCTPQNEEQQKFLAALINIGIQGDQFYWFCLFTAVSYYNDTLHIKIGYVSKDFIVDAIKNITITPEIEEIITVFCDYFIDPNDSDFLEQTLF